MENEEEIVLPSSNDIFQKMLEEELRKEEERMKNQINPSKQKGVAPINNNSEDKPLRPPPSSIQPLASISPTSSVESPNFLISPKNINNFLSDAPVENKIRTSNTETSPMEVLKVEKNVNTPSDDFEVHVTIPKAFKESSTNGQPSPESVPNSVSGETPSSPQDSTILFETMLKEELEKSKPSETEEEKPAWKKKVEELDELINKFKRSDPNDNLFSDNENELSQALNNRHPNILEKGVETLYHYVNKYKNVQNTAEKFINLLVDKGLSSKSSVQQKTTDILLLYFEVCDPTLIITILKGFFSNKKAKVRSQCIGIVKMAVQDFGLPTIPPKIILQSLPTILEDASSREESHKLAMEIFKWLGYEAVEPHIKDVKSSKLKALKEEYDSILDKTPKASRFSRLLSVSASSNNINLKNLVADDMKPKKETIDLNEKLRKEWHEDVVSPKWVIRKDAFDELKKLIDSFNVKKADYSDIISQINVVMQREKNVAVVKESIECLTSFSKALKTDFTITAKSMYERLLTKVKEKKLSDPTIECLVSFDSNTFPFTDMLDTIFSAMNNKTASPPEKLQLFSFIDKCLENKKKKELDKPLKSLTSNLISFCDDASSEVRDTCCRVVARLLFIVGDSDIVNNFLKLDSYTKEKIVQYLESLGLPTTEGVGKKLSQSIEKKPTPSATIPKTSVSISRPSSRAGDVRSSTTSLKKSISSKPATSKQISQKKPEIALSLSSSDVIDEANSLFGESTVEKLGSNNWTDRIVALNTIESTINSLEKSELQTKHEHIITFFQYKPGLKESNAKVLEKVFEIIENILSVTENKLSEVNIPPIITWMVDKQSTAKVDIAAQKALKKICESINPQFVFSKISENLTDKPPKLIGSILEWLGEIITEFSIACFNSNELIDFAKKYLGNSNPMVKKGCIKMLCSMKLFMGEGLSNFLGDVKPALLDMVKKEFSKVDTNPPEPTRKVKGESLKVNNGSYDTLPRCDILPKLNPKIYHNLEDKNWMTRLEAIQTVEKIIVNDAHKRILPNILELIHALRQRLEDVNIKVVTSALVLIDVISEALGTEMEKFLKVLLPSIVSKSMHNNKAVRTSALESLEKHLNIVPFESMLKFFPKAIASDKGNPEGKKEVIEFMYNHIASMKNKNIDLLAPLVKPILDYLQARPDSRKLAEGILTEIISNGGYDCVFKRVRELKPAFQKSLAPLLQKYASIEQEIQPLPQVSQSLALPTTPSNSHRGDKKITLRDVSKSLNMDINSVRQDQEEEEGSKVPKTVKKRANISKTLVTSPTKSPPNSPKQVSKPTFVVPKLHFLTSSATVDEYKLDLDKIEVHAHHESPLEAETPMHEMYNTHHGPLPGNSTPRMPERSPVRDNKKEEPVSGHSVGELVKAINNNEHGSEVAINALKTLVSMFKDESCRPAILSYLKELVESLTDNTQYSFEKASAGLVSTRICKYLLSTLMQLFSNRQMAAFVPQETLQRMIDQLLSRLLDERLPSLDYGQELLRGLNSLMLKVLENSNRTYSYTSLIHLLEYSYANASLKKYTELVVKCLIKLTKALVATIDRVDVDILLMDLHSFLTHNPPTFFKDRNDLPLRTIKTILNELVKVKGETIRSCLGLIPTHKNPLIISYIELMVNSTQAIPSSNTSVPNSQPTSIPLNNTIKPRASLASNPITNSTGANDKLAQDELTDIFNLISNKDSTHTGLYRLYEFKKTHPSISINTHLSKCSEPFQQYIHRQLAKIAQYESSKQENFASSSHRAQSPASKRQQMAVTSVDDIRRQLKLHQQESKQKNMGRSLTVSDLKKRIQNIEEKLSSTDGEPIDE